MPRGREAKRICTAPCSSSVCFVLRGVVGRPEGRFDSRCVPFQIPRIVTNIVLLSLSLLPTNIFGYGATDEFGGWARTDCVTVTLTYATQTSGVYVVEYTSSPEGSHCNTNGCFGMRWTILNCGGLTNGAHNRLGPYPINHAAPRGYFTNALDGPSVHTIAFPTPRWEHQFFRFRKVGESYRGPETVAHSLGGFPQAAGRIRSSLPL